MWGSGLGFFITSRAQIENRHRTIPTIEISATYQLSQHSNFTLSSTYLIAHRYIPPTGKTHFPTRPTNKLGKCRDSKYQKLLTTGKKKEKRFVLISLPPYRFCHQNWPRGYIDVFQYSLKKGKLSDKIRANINLESWVFVSQTEQQNDT